MKNPFERGPESKEEKEKREIIGVLVFLGFSTSEARSFLERLLSKGYKLESILSYLKSILRRFENAETDSAKEKIPEFSEYYRDWLAKKLKEYRAQGEEGKGKAREFLAEQQKTNIYKYTKEEHLAEKKKKKDDLDEEERERN